jgi:FixJ family two-component response regulator
MSTQSIDASMSNVSSQSLVCIVDDDPHIRDGLKVLFESVGIPSICFASTRDLLNSKQIATANCLVLDVRLPGLGGLDFQAELAKSQIKIPIIFITAHGDVPMSVKAMKAGAVEFLIKPFREQDILDAVRLAVERDRVQRSHDQALHKLKARYETLTEREREVMQYVVSGFLNKQTAAKMRISEITVKVHRHNVMNKLDAKSLPDLVRIADVIGVLRLEAAERESEDRKLGS